MNETRRKLIWYDIFLFRFCFIVCKVEKDMNSMNFAFFLFVTFLIKNEYVIGQSQFSSTNSDKNINSKYSENNVGKFRNDFILTNNNQASQSTFFNSKYKYKNSLSNENKNVQAWINDDEMSDKRRIDIGRYLPKSKNSKKLKPIVNNGYTLDLNIDVFRSTVILLFFILFF